MDNIVQKIQSGVAYSYWAFTNGLVMYKDWLYLPTVCSLIPSIISSIHNPTHEGIQKTMYRAQAGFHWQGMQASIRDFIQNCSICKQRKWENLHPAGHLQPLSIPTQIWADISMDFIEGLPKVGGKSVLYVVIDHFIPLYHPYNATSFARLFHSHFLFTWTPRIYC